MERIIDLLKNTLHIDIKETHKDLQFNKKIPFLLKQNYEIKTVTIENIDFAILIANKDKLQSIKKHFDIFSDALLVPIIIYAEKLSSLDHRYFIKNNIPFITKSSIYLPQLLTYLGDITNKPKPKINNKLSKLAQQVLIDSIISSDKEIEINTTAKKFSVTNMSASRVLKELYNQELLTVSTTVRKKTYKLKENLSFDKLISLLSNPKIEEVYIHKEDIVDFTNIYLSSFSAMSSYTNITSIETIYAIHKKDFSKHFSKIATYEQQYDNDLVKLEIWKYIPINYRDNVVEPISLYMVMKDEPISEDSRFDEAMKQLEEKIKGMLVYTGYR